MKRLVREKYTYEECREVALKYKSRTELNANYPSINTAIKKNKWTDLYSHMIKLKRDKVTYEESKEIISKFKTIKDLKENEPSILTIIRRNGWGELLLGLNRINRKKVTYEECQEITLKYKTLKEFKTENKSLYTIMCVNGWLKELTKHMIKSGNKYKRCIYAYEFNDEKSVYIGLTYNIKARDKQHRNRKESAHFKFSEYNNIEIPTPIRLTDYLNKDIASKLEGDFLEKYKRDGWFILNIAPTGGLGGNNRKKKKIYIKEEYINLAKEYIYFTDFRKNNARAYTVIRQNNWSEEAFNHMKKYASPHMRIVNKIDKNTYIILETYNSITEATKNNNMSTGHISACCNGKRKTAGGFIWKYDKK